MNKVTDAFGYWFAGFTDGEGCFAIGKDKRKSSCAKYNCQFSITLRDDDKAILELIRDTLGFGRICDIPNYSCNPNVHVQARLDVCAISQCAKLVKIFLKYPLLAKKRNDFEIWRQAVTEIRKPFNCRDANLLEYYYRQIREVRKYEKQNGFVRPTIKELQLTIKFE